MGMVLLARTARQVSAPNPSQPGSLRGYYVGIGPRKTTGGIVAETATRATCIVAEVKWDEAQPTALDNTNGVIASGALSEVDAAIALGAPYDRIKVRIFTGITSPAWAKALGGGPMPWGNADGSVIYDVPVWFSSEFLDAYEAFVEALAAELAGRSDKVVEVTLAGATTIFSEPCIRQIGWDDNYTTALAHGYTEVGDLDAIKQCVDIHHEHMSPIGIVTSVAYNSMQYFNTTLGVGRVKLASTFELMEYQRDIMGKYAVWENNSLGAMYDEEDVVQPRVGDYPDLYAFMAEGAAQGTAIQFQSMNRRVMNEKYPGVTCDATADYAVQLGAISVEMPGALAGYPDWTADFTEAKADEVNAALLANAETLPYFT